jgi:hypothetical protein
MSIVDTIKSWFRQEGAKAEEAGDGSVRDPDRETSTNAQVEGTAGEPYPDED